MATQIINEKKLEKCAEAAFMAVGGWKLRGAYEMLDEQGKNRWRLIAVEVLLEIGCEVQREVKREE